MTEQLTNQMTGDLDGWLLTITRVGAIGGGLLAGVFFIFSVCIMPALDRLSPASGMAAMQTINTVIENAFFLPLLLGTGVVGALLAVTSAWTWDEPAAGLRLSGGVLYVVGVIVLTIAYHVPRNNALDAVSPDSAGAVEAWATYLREWTPWNHVRTLASAASAILLTLALSD